MAAKEKKRKKVVVKQSPWIEYDPVLDYIQRAQNYVTEEKNSGKTVVFTYARMNPPTTGHERLVKKMQRLAEQKGADVKIFLSHTVDHRNPMIYEDKLKYAKKAFGDSVQDHQHKNVIDILKGLEGEGYNNVHMVVGEDQYHSFNRMLPKYNGKDYKFKNVSVHSAGHRDPNDEGVMGVSSTKARGYVTEHKYKEFSGLMPKAFSDSDKRAIYKLISNGKKGQGK